MMLWPTNIFYGQQTFFKVGLSVVSSIEINLIKTWVFILKKVKVAASRADNFSEEEKNVLAAIIKPFSHIIENKKCDVMETPIKKRRMHGVVSCPTLMDNLQIRPRDC